MRTTLKFMAAGGYTPAPDPPPPSPTLWTPANIGSSLALWYDPSDAATVTLNGSNVQQINDKSGNSRQASQATSANQPVYTTAGINGLNVMTFDGTNDTLEIANALSIIQNVGWVGCWSVFQIANTTGTKNLLFISTTGGGSTSWFASAVNNSATNIAGRRLFADSFAQVFGSFTLTANTSYISGSEAHYELATSYQTITGVSNSGAFQTAGNTQNNPTTFNPRIGSTGIPTNFHAGIIGEQLLLTAPTRATTDTIQRIEGYLAHKWGLTAGLPGGHPYKTNAPTV